jgi:hypothetical protein
VHVFDDITLGVIMQTLDTVSDFVAYLSKKEALLTRGKPSILATGEEDLLAYYLQRLNKSGEHDFVLPSDLPRPERLDFLFLEEGAWVEFLRSPERQSQVEANEVSYAWDALIETFIHHAVGRTQYWTSHPALTDQEKMLRFLAREPRTRRRFLARTLLEFIENTPATYRAVQVIKPSRRGDPYYVFVLIPHLPSVSYDDYRVGRREFLLAYCKAAKLKFPEANDIVGIATESGRMDNRSDSAEDLIYFDARTWTDEQDRAEAESLRQDLRLLTSVTKFRKKEYDYPIKQQCKRRPKGKVRKARR